MPPPQSPPRLRCSLSRSRVGVGSCPKMFLPVACLTADPAPPGEGSAVPDELLPEPTGIVEDKEFERLLQASQPTPSIPGNARVPSAAPRTPPGLQALCALSARASGTGLARRLRRPGTRPPGKKPVHPKHPLQQVRNVARSPLIPRLRTAASPGGPRPRLPALLGGAAQPPFAMQNFRQTRPGRELDGPLAEEGSPRGALQIP